MISDFDVAIIGLGVAGCCAAKVLEGSGLKIIAFDSFAFPRKKLCGGGLTLKCYNLLSEIFGDITPVVKGRAHRLYLVNGKNVIETVSENPFILFVDRKSFDNFLYRTLSDTVIHDGEKVVAIVREKEFYRIETEKGFYRARFIIGADGINGVTPRVCGVNLKKALTYEMDIESDTKESALVDFSDFKSGYYWIFPKGDFYTTGFGDFSLLKARNLEDINRKFNKKYGIKGKVISRGGAFIPVFDGRLYSGEGGILLTGDAASMVDPFTGEGIYFAAVTGKRAAELVVRYFNDKDKLGVEYRKFLDSFVIEFKWALFLRRLFFKFKTSMFKVMEVSDEVLSVATDIISSDIRYNEAFKRFLKSSIKLPMRFVYVTGFDKKRKRKESKGFSSLDI
ncbi:geranylgeranyl reductase family protein [Desulfurobacterium sp.]